MPGALACNDVLKLLIDRRPLRDVLDADRGKAFLVAAFMVVGRLTLAPLS
jgi:hypothetical protein